MKKDFILKNYNKLVLVFAFLWLIAFWAGNFIKKLIPGWVNPLDQPIWVMVLVSILPIGLAILEYYRQGWIFERITPQKYDLVKLSRFSREYLCLSDPNIDIKVLYDPKDQKKFHWKGKLKYAGNFIEACKENNIHKPNAKRRDTESNFEFLGANSQSQNRGVIMLYHLYLKWYADTFGGVAPPMPKNWNI